MIHYRKHIHRDYFGGNRCHSTLTKLIEKKREIKQTVKVIRFSEFGKRPKGTANKL